MQCVLTSWRNTNPEIPATNSARKTSERNIAYCRETAKQNVDSESDARQTPRDRMITVPPLVMHQGLLQPLTSFSIHGLPLQVAKHPNRPKTMMTVPVPMRTYGALVELSAIREMYGPSINFPHTPTASRMAPVIWVWEVERQMQRRESS